MNVLHARKEKKTGRKNEGRAREWRGMFPSPATKRTGCGKSDHDGRMAFSEAKYGELFRVFKRARDLIPVVSHTCTSNWEVRLLHPGRRGKRMETSRRVKSQVKNPEICGQGQGNRGRRSGSASSGFSLPNEAAAE